MRVGEAEATLMGGNSLLRAGVNSGFAQDLKFMVTCRGIWQKTKASKSRVSASLVRVMFKVGSLGLALGCCLAGLTIYLDASSAGEIPSASAGRCLRKCLRGIWEL